MSTSQTDPRDLLWNGRTAPIASSIIALTKWRSAVYSMLAVKRSLAAVRPGISTAPGAASREHRQADEEVFSRPAGPVLCREQRRLKG